MRHPYQPWVSLSPVYPAWVAPTSRTLKTEMGHGNSTWFNVVLADTDDQLTSNTVPGMNMVLSIVFRTRAGEVCAACCLLLLPSQLYSLTVSPRHAAGLTEGFFLSQERQSGQWQLRWRAPGDAEGV